MKIYNLPDDFNSDEEQRSPVIIRAYQSRNKSLKNKAILHQYMVDIILSGRKSIMNIDQVTNFEAGELMILAKGNCVISQALPENDLFSSVVLYFTNQVFMDFLIKYQGLAQSLDPAGRKPMLLYRQDKFIRYYLDSLQAILQSPAGAIVELKQLKLEELLLYLFSQDPSKLMSLRLAPVDDEDMQLKRAVESNICNPVTVEDLAFLCNMSLSSFKRRFNRLYGSSPIKWLVEQKMQIAADLLKDPIERPSLVFEKIGYESHSSFTQAFKQHFRITPKEYREQKLNVWRQDLDF